jgi:hypothetical protein
MEIWAYGCNLHCGLLKGGGVRPDGCDTAHTWYEQDYPRQEWAYEASVDQVLAELERRMQPRLRLERLPQAGHGHQPGRRPASKRIRPKEIAELLATGRAVWKFVAADVEDLDEIDWWIERFGLPIDIVRVMPEGTSAAGLTADTQQLADAVLACGLNLTTRLHILVWGAERDR